MKPSPCTPPHQQLSKETKERKNGLFWFGGSHKYKRNETKQTNYLPS
jgi:hypothetical protein